MVYSVKHAADDVEVPAQQVDARKGQVLRADHDGDQKIAEYRRHDGIRKKKTMTMPCMVNSLL